MAVSKLINFIKNPRYYIHTTGEKPETQDANSEKNKVVCSYLFTWTKCYLILIIWAQYILDMYFTYVRQFTYMNSVTSVPDELKPYYTKASFEEAKIHHMFRTLVHLETNYHHAINLTVVYLANIYCSLWWVASKITTNIITRAIVFNMFISICQYRSGDVIRHINIILSSYSVSEKACKTCYWIKDILTKSFNNMATMRFMEEILMTIMLTMVTTPMCILIFLSYRMYKSFLLPIIIEESTAQYLKLEEGELFNLVTSVCNEFNQPFNFIYISYRPNDEPNAVRIRGYTERKYLILGSRLVDGHTPNTSKKPYYTKNEIAAAVLRTIARSSVVIPNYDFALEVTRWISVMLFAIFLTFGLCGGSRLGFVPSPPQVISYAISKHLSIPIFLVVQILRNYLHRQRNLKLDDQVGRVGFAEDLISYIGKEAMLSYKCPIEDPFYTVMCSENSPTIDRIRNLTKKFITKE